MRSRLLPNNITFDVKKIVVEVVKNS